MVEDQEPLQYLPLEKCDELQNIFKADWPRGISGYAALEIQKQLRDQGIDYEIKVYCPYGDVKNGMVAINCKLLRLLQIGFQNWKSSLLRYLETITSFTYAGISENCYEAIIQCPNEDTAKLSDALKRTSVIDWNREVLVPYAPRNVIECLRNTVQDINMNLDVHRFLHTFILEREFDDVSLPPNITFGLITMEYLDLVDSTWPQRYPNSSWHFELLIKARCGYGLFLNNNLISWVFIKEVGPLQHLYTLETHRKKGYGELLLKLASNIWLKEGKPVFAFCFKDNINACELYRKLGFVEGEPIAWCYLHKNK